MQRVISICTDTLNAETTKLFWDAIAAVSEKNRWLHAPGSDCTFVVGLVDETCALFFDLLQCYELQQICFRLQLMEVFEIDGVQMLREFADHKKADAQWFAIEQYAASLANGLNSLLAESGVPMKPGSKLDAIIDQGTDEEATKLEMAKWSERIAQTFALSSSKAS